MSRRWFATIRPGDDVAIAAVLAREYTIYADHPQTTLAELAEMVTRQPLAGVRADHAVMRGLRPSREVHQNRA